MRFEGSHVVAFRKGLGGNGVPKLTGSWNKRRFVGKSPWIGWYDLERVRLTRVCGGSNMPKGIGNNILDFQ